MKREAVPVQHSVLIRPEDLGLHTEDVHLQDRRPTFYRPTREQIIAALVGVPNDATVTVVNGSRETGNWSIRAEWERDL